MKLLLVLGLTGLFGGSLAVAAEQLQLVPDAKSQRIFIGAQNVSATFYNAGDKCYRGGIRAQVYQTTSATAVAIPENPPKPLQVPAGEMVLTSSDVQFPTVKAETKFLIQWLDDADHVVGATSVLVYPTNLFQVLQPFLCKTNFGVLDPANQLKPLLKAQGISFADLGETVLDNFSGRLAIIGPFPSPAQVPRGLADRVKAIAKKNVAVVWIQPAEPAPASLGWEREKIEPSFYCVQKGQTAVVVVQPGLVSGLAENPQSQITLICLCHLALNPPSQTLPGLASPL